MSVRRYACTLDPVAAEVAERGASSSPVAGRFVALSAKCLQWFLSQPSGELGVRVVCIDGKVFRERCMVVALGIDAQGCKHVLGLREGATEMAAVASDLVTRGLATHPMWLFVINGHRGCGGLSAMSAVRGVVQRCQVHKARNVLGHLADRLHASVGKAFGDACGIDSGDRAARVLSGWRCLWKRDHMSQLWMASALLEGEPGFRRVRGYGAGRFPRDACAGGRDGGTRTG